MIPTYSATNSATDSSTTSTTTSPTTSDDLAPEVVLRALNTRRLGRPYHRVIACPSTNDLCAALAAEDGGRPEGLLVAADSQTAGRGRLGRAWHSPPGENLYVSLLLRPPLPPWS